MIGLCTLISRFGPKPSGPQYREKFAVQLHHMRASVVGWRQDDHFVDQFARSFEGLWGISAAQRAL
jgi:hypothetical protein